MDAVQREESVFVLGEVLRCDMHLDLPPRAVRAVYRRLFDLGVHDLLTRLCYAQYVDFAFAGDSESDEAAEILAEIEPLARQAGFLDEGPGFGRHPVYYEDWPIRPNESG